MAFCRLFTLHFGFMAQPVESLASSQNRLASKLLAPTTLFPATMGVAAPVLFMTHRRLPISPKPWDVGILKLNGLVKRYSQIKWIFSIEVAKDKSLISFNRNSHAKMAPDTDCLIRGEGAW
jgi:hypothetical protein